MAAMTMAAKLAYGFLGLAGVAVVGAATGVIPVQDWVDRVTAQQSAPAQLLATPTEDETQPPAASSDDQEVAVVVPDTPVPDDASPVVAPEADIIVPAFDLLRVEPDGSVVIAGRAAPSAEVEAFSGTTSLGAAAAEANGDFVIVFDDRLDPGDYEIVLRADAPDGTTATSTETAIVSVPEQGDDGVLALVEEPGEPSRLISTGDGAAEPLVPVVPDEEVAVAETESAPAENAQIEPAQSEPESTETEVATVPESPVEDVTPATDITAEVRIEAVEIDGEKLFVAGAATPGSRLNVYANDMLLGTTTASPAGRFLIEVNRDLPVGDYLIRADLLAENGSDVIVRAVVPFQRQPGERLAAVAVAEPARLPDTPPAITSSDSDQIVVPQALGELSGAPVVPQPATAEASAPALTPVDSSVIIRRGDTLWQISRRVYGQGVKYTTIYLANQEQIRDPDRIWPGQVFGVPDQAAEDAEDVHRQLRERN